MSEGPWTWQRGDDPLLAVAIHAGSELRPDVAGRTALTPAQRRREEDAGSECWTDVAANRLVVHRSRWEVDVNRPRERAVYLQPEDCWGLRPWHEPPPPDVLDESYGLYDAFYEELFDVCRELEGAYGSFVVLDLHSYNHRRLGPGGPAADPASNPEINLGTASMNDARWRPLADRYIADLREAGLDIRENVRFEGAELAARIHAAFPDTGCCLAVDVKKVYVDEHTDTIDDEEMSRITTGLAAGVPGLRASLRARL